MSYVPWVPVVVGGTDHVEKPFKSKPIVEDIDGGGAIVLTHEELTEYSNSLFSLPKQIQEHMGIETFHFEYGPIKTIISDDTIRRGQYVIEYRNGFVCQTFWIEKV